MPLVEPAVVEDSTLAQRFARQTHSACVSGVDEVGYLIWAQERRARMYAHARSLYALTTGQEAP